MSKSCMTCPSYVEADEITTIKTRFDRLSGGPMCGRFGHILGSAHSTSEELGAIATHTAATCDSYADEMPDVMASHLPYVSESLIEDETYLIADGDRTKPDSCRKCKFMISEDIVFSELGWSIPLCGLRGKLLFKPLAEARGCQYGDAGPGVMMIEDLTIYDHLVPGFKISDEVILNDFVWTDIHTEPSQHDSDAPVSDQDASDGILAWRRISDPKNKDRFVNAPVFGMDRYTEIEAMLVPTTGGKGNPELYMDYNQLLYHFFVEVIKLQETPVLVGPPGTGKTQFFRWAAWLCQMPFRRLQFQSEMDVTEMLGSVAYSPDKGTFFEPGILPQAWQAIGILDGDEPNVAPDPVLQVLRPVTDNSKELIIENFAFQRNKYCYFGMAMNPSFDFRNLGTKEFADADSNRLSFLKVEPAPEPVERHLIRTYCKQLDDYDIPDDIVNVLMKIAADIRQLEADGQYPGTWATRQMIKVARKTRWYDVEDAFKVATLNNMPQEVCDLVHNSFITNMA